MKFPTLPEHVVAVLPAGHWRTNGSRLGLWLYPDYFGHPDVWCRFVHGASKPYQADCLATNSKARYFSDMVPCVEFMLRCLDEAES